MSKYESMIIIAIDPGMAGGFAWKDYNGVIHVANMGETPRDILDQIRDIKDECDEYGNMLTPDKFICYLEDVGKGRGGESMSAMCSFARHNGNLEAFLMAEDIAVVKVLPQKWQKTLGIGKANECATKSAWKNKIKAKEQERHPLIKVTLKNADALGILDYALGING